MLNQLLKFTLVSSILLWLKPRWRGLLALTAFVLLVHVLHAEYLGYVELSEDRQYLVASYFVKWLGLVCALVVYYMFAVAGLRISGLPVVAEKRAAVAKDQSLEIDSANRDDGFDFLREKKQLESRADKLLDSQEK